MTEIPKFLRSRVRRSRPIFFFGRKLTPKDSFSEWMIFADVALVLNNDFDRLMWPILAYFLALRMTRSSIFSPLTPSAIADTSCLWSPELCIY